MHKRVMLRETMTFGTVVVLSHLRWTRNEILRENELC